ncbi:YheC/YheD family protein [Paenibacillus campi]|uniref:YheC/YheD family protein n=1 Tax=Paenibacillus campi TaxID=3106031 RepID=UPI002AFF712C|nr:MULTISPECIES: YheC/YheD family protein [unclassified Paenibacillus]
MQAQQRRPVIAVLIGWEIGLPMLTACALSAAGLGADFYYFYPAGVDEQRQRIRGFKLRYGVWEAGEFPYPDVVYDRMRRREVQGFTEVYRKLEGVLFTHTLRGRWGRKSVIYNLLREDAHLKQHLIPFQTLRDAQAGLEFIYRHGAVVIKSDKGASGRNILIVQVTDNTIEVLDQHYVHRLNEAQLLELLTTLIPQKYCLQRMIHSETENGLPFHIRVHLTKDGHGKWTVGFCAPSISLDPHRKITNSEHTFRATPTWELFLKQHVHEQPGGKTDRYIRQYAIRLAQFMDERLQGSFHEIGLDIGLDEQGQIWMFEAGLGLPFTSFYYVEMALPALAYSLYMLEQAEASER